MTDPVQHCTHVTPELPPDIDSIVRATSPEPSLTAGRWARGDWMQTYSGRKFYPMDPRADEIHLIDIAQALSMQCRCIDLGAAIVEKLNHNATRGAHHGGKAL